MSPQNLIFGEFLKFAIKIGDQNEKDAVHYADAIPSGNCDFMQKN
jgi:hypothetical protein